MLHPRFALVILALLAGLSTAACTSASAADAEPFTKARFDALQEQDALILVDVAADWCPTCARQASVIGRYQEAHPDVPLHVLRVDYDEQKEWVRHFRAPRQSTLLLFRGTERVWFAVAETDEAVISAAIDGAAEAR